MGSHSHDSHDPRPAWQSKFTPAELAQMERDDLDAWTRVMGVLFTVVIVGVLLMTITVFGCW